MNHQITTTSGWTAESGESGIFVRQSTRLLANGPTSFTKNTTTIMLANSQRSSTEYQKYLLESGRWATIQHSAMILILSRLLPILLLLLLSPSGAVLSCFAFGAASSLSTLKLHSWKPCVQPRFDEFASSTVGPWVTRASTTEKLEVEEVMRSCGGAVQGIRELSLSVASQSPFSNEEKIYLNRADGGFVYIDDGSYSFGPEKWDLQTDEAIANWRHHADHMVVQVEGKRSVFKSYRLRVAEVIRDYDFSSSSELS